jgi:hypothetical protein
MAPLGGLFATQRCHRVENKWGRCDRYVAKVRFGRSADAHGLEAEAPGWARTGRGEPGARRGGAVSEGQRSPEG